MDAKSNHSVIEISDGIGFLRGFPAIHRFTTLEAGNMSYKFGSMHDVNYARERVLSLLSIDKAKVVSMDVEHSDGVVAIEDLSFVTNSPLGRYISCDAFMTDVPGITLLLTVADCLPIYLGDKDNRATGLVHAGRAGTELDVTHRAVYNFAASYGIKFEDILVFIGPGICAQCYGQDILTPNIEQLEWLGVPKENIYKSNMCTCCYSVPPIKGARIFPSHYRWWNRERKQGCESRFMALITKRL